MKKIILIMVLLLVIPPAQGKILAGPGKPYYLGCTGSMRPTLTCNDTFELREVKDRYDIPVGTIVWINLPNNERVDEEYQYLVHRIISVVRMNVSCGDGCMKRGDYYITKGDANPVNDYEYWNLKINPAWISYYIYDIKGKSIYSSYNPYCRLV